MPETTDPEPTTKRCENQNCRTLLGVIAPDGRLGITNGACSPIVWIEKGQRFYCGRCGWRHHWYQEDRRRAPEFLEKWLAKKLRID